MKMAASLPLSDSKKKAGSERKDLTTGRGDDEPAQNGGEADNQAEREPKNKKKGPRRIELEPVSERSAPVEANGAEAKDAIQEKAPALEADQDYWRDKPRLSRDEVLEEGGKHIKDPEQLKEFQKDVEAFEARSKKDGVSDLERETFYGQVGKVLDASQEGNKFYNGEQLQSIATSMMKHAGYPGSVNQGREPTCTTAAMESVLYSKEPNTIGEVVSEVALTGQYITANGAAIKVPERNLMPDKYKADTPEQKARSLASHIFQPLSINIKWHNQDSYPGQGDGKQGKLVYEEGHPKDHPGDPQTRIMDYSTNPPSPVTEGITYVDPLQDKDAPVALLQDIRPAEAPYMHMDDLPRIYAEMKGREGSLTTVNISKGDNVETPESKEEFQKLLESAATNGGEDGPSFPLLLGVHANLEPFHTDLKEYSKNANKTKGEQDSESAMHAHHAVAITGYDPETKMVSLENQWGPKADHTGEEGHKAKIHIDDLYRTFTGLSSEEQKQLADSKPQKEPTGDEIIEDQRKFVEEIAKDEDQNPEKVWQERRELYRRLSHFGKTEEASEQRDILLKDFKQLTAGKDFDEVTRLGSNMATSLRGAGEDDLAKSMVSEIEDQFIDSITANPNSDTPKQIEKLLDLHRYRGDEKGRQDLIDKYLDRTIGDNSKLDVADEKDRETMLDAIQFAKQSGNGEIATKYFESMVDEINQLGQSDEANESSTIAAKADMLYTANSLGEKDTANQLAGELQMNYEDLSKGVHTDKDFTAKPISDVRMALRNHYGSTNQPEKLVPLIDDYMRYHQELRREDGNPLGEAHKELIDPLQYFGDELQRGGAIEKSEEYLSRGLDLARKHDPDQAPRIALKLAQAQIRLGKTEEAEELKEEFELPSYLFRRRTR